MNKFEELKIHCRDVEDPRQTLSCSKPGLRVEIHSHMVTHGVQPGFKANSAADFNSKAPMADDQKKDNTDSCFPDKP